MRLFVYGTLMDPEVRAIVFDEPALVEAGQPARLAGWRRQAILGGLAPVLVAHPHGAVDGLLLPPLGRRAAARVSHFEGRHAYRLAGATVATAAGPVAAQLFLPTGAIRPHDRGWDLAAWRRRHKRAFLARARRHMASFPARRAGAD